MHTQEISIEVPSQGARRATGEGSTNGWKKPERFSARQKTEVVLRLLRGEALDLVSRELGVPAARLAAWREAFLAAGQDALKKQPLDSRDREIGRLREKLGEATMEMELLRENIARLETTPPFTAPEVETMRQATSPSTGKPYGLAQVCRVGGIARSTVYWQRRERPMPAARRGPLGPCADDELVDHIRRVLEASPFPGEGYRKVWARLRPGGIRTSPRRVLRLMRAHHLLAPTRQGHPHGPKAHDGTIIPAQVDTMWGTDMTATYTRQDGQVAIFIAVDHYSAECVGIHASKQGTRFEALEPIRQGVRTAFGAFGQDIAQGLLLRHDHGSQYMAHVFQEELTFLGITSSPAFVREPEGNGCAERFIRTLKENLLWLTTFDTVEALRLALHEFQRQYNATWLIGRHGYKAPAQVRREQQCVLADAA